MHAHYLYDAAGQRVKKLVRTQGGQVEVTHYLERASSTTAGDRHRHPGENNHMHVMDDQQRIALVRVGDRPPRRPRARPCSTTSATTSAAATSSSTTPATSTNREEYTPYGETSFGSYARKRYRFTGKERDEESGLGYHAPATTCLPWHGGRPAIRWGMRVG